jgi:hypothetical protein
MQMARLLSEWRKALSGAEAHPFEEAASVCTQVFLHDIHRALPLLSARLLENTFDTKNLADRVKKAGVTGAAGQSRCMIVCRRCVIQSHSGQT